MEIPHYPASRSIDISDKGLLDGYFSSLQPRISELTFANLFLFRRVHDYRLTWVGESLVVLGRWVSGVESFLPPLGGGADAAAVRLLEDGLSMYGAGEESVGRWAGGERYLVESDRAAADYLYLRGELAELPGSRFHKKKNRINYFTARHVYQAGLIGQSDIEGCRELLKVWQQSISGLKGDSDERDFAACEEALMMMGELGLEGVLVRVSGIVKAFAVGERLNSNTAVCHFEKADPFVEGVSQLINREFARQLFTDCHYLNREQDLGEQGLRAAKLSYHPAELVQKFRVVLQSRFQQKY
jgi:uncharacterized protein